MDGYHCYGCDPNSPQGLRMEFYENGDEIVSVWHPRPEYQGWVNTLHGGIQATLADEISSWVVFRKFQTSGVTSKMEVRYHKPIHTTDDHIVLRASVRRQRRNIVEIEVRIYDRHEVLCTEAVCVYFLFPPDKVRYLLHNMLFDRCGADRICSVTRSEFHFCDCGVEAAEENPLNK